MMCGINCAFLREHFIAACVQIAVGNMLLRSKFGLLELNLWNLIYEISVVVSSENKYSDLIDKYHIDL